MPVSLMVMSAPLSVPLCSGDAMILSAIALPIASLSAVSFSCVSTTLEPRSFAPLPFHPMRWIPSGVFSQSIEVTLLRSASAYRLTWVSPVSQVSREYPFSAAWRRMRLSPSSCQEVLKGKSGTTFVGAVATWAFISGLFAPFSRKISSLRRFHSATSDA